MDVNNKERKEFHTKEYVAPIEDFEHRFPCMFKHAISFDEIDYDKVYIELDDGRTLYYDRFYNFYWNVKRFNSIYELSEEEWRKGFSDRLRKRLRTKIKITDRIKAVLFLYSEHRKEPIPKGSPIAPITGYMPFPPRSIFFIKKFSLHLLF